MPEGGKLGRFDELEVLPEMQPHLGLPLPDQSFGRDHQDPLRHAAQLELAQDQPGLDRLAQPHFVRQQVSDPIPAHGAVERIELVRQRHDARLDGRQQEVFLQRVQQLRRRRSVQDVLDRGLDGIERLLGRPAWARTTASLSGSQTR